MMQRRELQRNHLEAGVRTTFPRYRWTWEHDYYAAGVGAVLEVVVKGGPERIEFLEVRTE